MTDNERKLLLLLAEVEIDENTYMEKRRDERLEREGKPPEPPFKTTVELSDAVKAVKAVKAADTTDAILMAKALRGSLENGCGITIKDLDILIEAMANAYSSRSSPN